MNVAGVLLAAGVGSRFHGNKHKLLTDVRGESIVGRSARSMVNSGLVASAVVSGSVDLTSALSEFPSLAILHNSAYEEGISTSIHVAIEWAEQNNFDAIVIGLGDQPGVLSASWLKLAQSNSPIAVATYEGKPGNPVCLAKSVWPLLPESGDEGARNLMRMRPELVKRVPCKGTAEDIDTVEDLGQWS